MSQKAMAVELGLSNTTLSNIEKGHNSPSVETLYILASRFNINTDYIVYGRGDFLIDPESFNVNPEINQITNFSDLLHFLKKSPFFYSTVIAFAAKCFYDNYDIIMRSYKDFQSLDKENK